jgi:aromatic ring-opening dioxygenase LigB subunit
LKIIPIGYSALDNQQHLEFGHHIHRMIDQSSSRVAVIACADLSPKLHQDSPAGFSPQGQEFDQKLITLIQNKDIEKIASLDPKLVEAAAGQEALRSLLILFGVIKDLNYQPKKLSYQSPFGIGYLVEHFQL